MSNEEKKDPYFYNKSGTLKKRFIDSLVERLKYSANLDKPIYLDSAGYVVTHTRTGLTEDVPENTLDFYCEFFTKEGTLKRSKFRKTYGLIFEDWYEEHCGILSNNLNYRCYPDECWDLTCEDLQYRSEEL